MNNFDKLIANSPLLQGLEEGELKELLQRSGCYPRSYERGQMLRFGKEGKSDFLFILQGRVKVEMVSPGGKTIRLRVLESPELLLPAFLNNSSRRLPVNMVALEETAILPLSKETLTEIIHGNRAFTSNFLTVLSERFTFLLTRLEFLNFHTIGRKLAYYLLSQLEEDSEPVRLPLSIREIAELFGVERPSLSRVLGDFTASGWIEPLKRGEYRIKDREALVKILI